MSVSDNDTGRFFSNNNQKKPKKKTTTQKHCRVKDPGSDGENLRLFGGKQAGLLADRRRQRHHTASPGPGIPPVSVEEVINVCMCVPERGRGRWWWWWVVVSGGEWWGRRSRACSDKFSRRGATLSAQVLACDKTLVSSTRSGRQLTGESEALETKTKQNKKNGTLDLLHRLSQQGRRHVKSEDTNLCRAEDPHHHHHPPTTPPTLGPSPYLCGRAR